MLPLVLPLPSPCYCAALMALARMLLQMLPHVPRCSRRR